MVHTACPLDCYDTCKIDYIDGKLKGDKTHPITQGYLCRFMDKYQSYPRIQKPTLNGKEITLQKALEVLKQKIDEHKDIENLYYQGSGNLALMQSVPKLFFSKAGFEIASGSMCDGAGDAGIEKGRGVNLALPYSQIQKSDVVILWGRNPKNSNKHLLPFLKGKTIIVIDPIKTDIAKSAKLHLQIKPRSDIYLAIMLSRLAMISNLEDEDFCKTKCENFDDFVEFIDKYPLVGLEKLCEISLLDAGKLLDIIKDKKVSILLGIGPQKYIEGADVFRAIDSFGALLGLFGKEGCGVSYLSNMTYGLEKPFSVKKSKYLKPNVDFSKFGVVFISNANPLSQMPNTPYVKSGYEKAKFRVYFGLWDNETAKMSDLVIPAANFLEKMDLKTSYSHEYVYDMPCIEKNDAVLSEYALTKSMFELFGYEDLKTEQEYIDELKSNTIDMKLPEYDKVPYSQGFYTKSKKFIFLDDFESEQEDNEEFYLLCSRQIKSLNSQFITDDILYVPTSLDFKDGEHIELDSRGIIGKFEVKNMDGLRDDCLLIYSGAKNINLFTKSRVSYDGDMALYQDFKVNIKRI